MSLKAFHILFITASVLLAIGFGLREIMMFVDRGDALHCVMGVVSLAGGVFLVWYGIRFLRKLRNVSFI